MDRQFLEFWGNFLINVAKGQKQLEDMAKWMGQGLSGVEDLTVMFRKVYGLDRLTEDTPDYLNAWEKAAENFQKSFKDYLSLFGVVPKEEHLTLVKKYNDLKEEVAEQEETIKRLKMLLGEKGVDQGEMVKGLHDLIEKQSGQFKELMKGFEQFLKQDAFSDEKK